MTQLEFLLTLLSLIVGIGLASLARSLRNLVGPRQTVRWHWLPLAWVIITFLIVANLWWGYYDGLVLDVWENYFAFIILLGEVMSLYLLCAFALPDLDWDDPARQQLSRRSEERSEETLDLKTFYFSRSHRYWYFIIFIVLLAFVEATESIEQYSKYDVVVWDIGETLRASLASAALILVVSEKEWVHTTVTLTVLFGMIWFISTYASDLG